MRYPAGGSVRCSRTGSPAKVAYSALLNQPAGLYHGFFLEGRIRGLYGSVRNELPLCFWPWLAWPAWASSSASQAPVPRLRHAGEANRGSEAPPAASARCNLCPHRARPSFSRRSISHEFLPSAPRCCRSTAATAADVPTPANMPSKAATATQRKVIALGPNSKPPLRPGFRSCDIPHPKYETALPRTVLLSMIRALLRRPGSTANCTTVRRPRQRWPASARLKTYQRKLQVAVSM